MKNHFVLLVVALTSSLGFAQETYKCKINGSTVYQDSPCLGAGRYSDNLPVKSAKAVPTANSNTAPVTGAQDVVKVPNETDRQKAFLAKGAKDRKIADYKYQIESTEGRISQLHATMQNELANVDVKRGYANNNLAGATYLQSLATEKQAITSRYESEISTQRASIKNLREELVRAEAN